MRSAAPLAFLALAAVAIFGVESACLVTGNTWPTEETKKCDRRKEKDKIRARKMAKSDESEIH